MFSLINKHLAYAAVDLDDRWTGGCCFNLIPMCPRAAHARMTG